ncbi:hypothetical protein [Bradyrhizobium sp. dw_78]|uniref:hypothetical protein n=1 Tax=Bradyrhizobium sp. dw_78 TaxID=2719793 RepID=UPI001BD50CFB|nr:hypothetical protein [Bradyrhizobium sp. dw_78]
MANVTPASLPSREENAPKSGLLSEFRAFLYLFFVKAFDPYRPELYYMRGPGPACRAKETALSPAVRSMLAEIRAAKGLKSQAPS